MHILTNEEYQRMSNEIDKVKYICKCGHRVIIPKYLDKKLCSWCKCYVFKSKEDEFKYKMKEKMKRGK